MSMTHAPIGSNRAQHHPSLAACSLTDSSAGVPLEDMSAHDDSGDEPHGKLSRRKFLLGASDGRSYVSGYFALELDGLDCGLIQKFEGGDIEAAVVEAPTSHDYYTKKHLGNLKYNEFSVQMGLSMGEPVRHWIESSLQMNFLRKSGELQSADFKRDIRQVREFHDALITEVAFPAADSEANDPAWLSLKFAPELTRNKKGSGKVDNPADVKQKTFFPGNFRFTIDGLEKACAKVTKVDALVVKQRTDSRTNPGGFREPAQLVFPNLQVTVSEEYAHDFWAWHEDFVVHGNNGEDRERSGSLVYLSPDRQKVLLELVFSGIGIFKGTTDESENNSDKIRRVTFEMYVENLVAKFGG